MAHGRKVGILPFSVSWLLLVVAGLLMVSGVGVGGCAGAGMGRGGGDAAISEVSISELGVRAVGSEAGGRPELSGARREWVSFGVRLEPGADVRRWGLRMAAIGGAGGAAGGMEPTPLEDLRVYSVVDVPVVLSRVGDVRENGEALGGRKLPLALVPLAASEEAGLVLLRGARPDEGGGYTLWVDVRVPLEAAPGQGTTAVEIVMVDGAGKTRGEPVASMPVGLRVWDFVLPAERSVVVVGSVGWPELGQAFGQELTRSAPRLLRRGGVGDGRSDAMVGLLDEMVAMGHDHRVVVDFPFLSPTVKWPAGSAPVVDTSDYETLITPWMTGEWADTKVMPVDKSPLAWLRVPEPERFWQFDTRSMGQYWSVIATYFDQRDWLGRTAVVLPGGKSAERLEGMVGAAVGAHPGMQVMAPSAYATAPNAGAGNGDVPRLFVPAAGAVARAADPSGRDDVRRFLSVSNAGDGPGGSGPAGGVAAMDARWPSVVGARQVNRLAWLATLRQAELIDMGDVGPTDAGRAWFLPGKLLGMEGVVPTVSLKLAMRAQQDAEYARLLLERGQMVAMLGLARLVAQPVEFSADRPVVYAFDLLGAADQTAVAGIGGVVDVFGQARQLAGMAVEAARIGEETTNPRRAELDILKARFAQRVYGRAILPESVVWRLTKAGPEALATVSVYDASIDPGVAVLEVSAPSPWASATMVQPRPLEAYRPGPGTARMGVTPVVVAADGLEAPVVRWSLAESAVVREVWMPVVSARRGVGAETLRLDGLLDDWQPGDAVHRGPLVRMMDRQTVAGGRVQADDRDSWIAVRQQEDGVAVGFRTAAPRGRVVDGGVISNTVARDATGRVWGEDAVTIYLQPVDETGMAGRGLRVVCKPTVVIVERQDESGKWVAVSQAAAYASRPNRAGGGGGANWQGEVLIPMALLGGDGRPVAAVAANFSRHYAETGFSATFAGPVDSEEDLSVTGLIVFDRE